MADEKDPYPEHTKLKTINHLSQAVSDFLDWLDERGIFLAYYAKKTDNFPSTVMTTKQTMLADHFGIDLKKLETEKEQMLEVQRALNEKEKSP